jgi:hypothetical protein
LVDRALRVTLRSAQGPGHAPNSTTITRRASNEWIAAAGEVSYRADRCASSGWAHRARGLCKTFPRGQGRATRVGAPVAQDPRSVATPDLSGRFRRHTLLELGRIQLCTSHAGVARPGWGRDSEPRGRMSGSAPARGAPRDSIVAPEPDFARPEFPGCVWTNRKRVGRGVLVLRCQ